MSNSATPVEPMARCDTNELVSYDYSMSDQLGTPQLIEREGVDAYVHIPAYKETEICYYRNGKAIRLFFVGWRNGGGEHFDSNIFKYASDNDSLVKTLINYHSIAKDSHEIIDLLAYLVNETGHDWHYEDLEALYTTMNNNPPMVYENPSEFMFECQYEKPNNEMVDLGWLDYDQLKAAFATYKAVHISEVVTIEDADLEAMKCPA